MATLTAYRRLPEPTQASITEGTPSGWTLGAVVAALGVLLSTVRVVGRGQRMVLLRFGRVVAVHGTGVVLVLPVLHTGVRVPVGPARVDVLWLDDVTSDGVPVTVSLTLLARVTDPAAYAEYARATHRPSAADDTEQAVEALAAEQLRDHVRRSRLAELAVPSREALATLADRIAGVVRHRGIAVDDVELARAEARLTDELLRWAAAQPAHGHDDRRSAMDMTRNRLRGVGTLHHVATRGDKHLGILITGDGRRHLSLYTSEDPDVPVQSVELDPDEADQLADLLHTPALSARLTELERRVTELTGEA